MTKRTPDRAPGLKAVQPTKEDHSAFVSELRERRGAPWRILVVDDHAGVRQGVIRLFGTRDDFEVVGEAADGAEAVNGAVRLAPDVVLMDVSMPVLDGVAATRQIARSPDAPAIVLFTAWADRDRIAEAMSAGASGHILKDAPPSELFAALQTALREPRRSTLDEATTDQGDRIATGSRPPRDSNVVSIRSRSGVRRWQVRMASGSAAVVLLGTAGAAAASEGRLPAPIQAAARFVGLPTPPTRLDDARQSVTRLDIALRSGDRAAIAAAVDQLNRRLHGLSASDQARLGTAGALDSARQRLGARQPAGATIAGPPNPADPASTPAAAPAATPPATDDARGGGHGGAGGGGGDHGDGDQGGTTVPSGTGLPPATSPPATSSPATVPDQSGKGGGGGGRAPSGGGGSPGGPPLTSATPAPTSGGDNGKGESKGGGPSHTSVPSHQPGSPVTTD